MISDQPAPVSRRRTTSRKVLKRDPETLATPDGEAIAVWRADATDPVTYLASVFDDLPRYTRARSGKHRP
ncbi:MAG: hypothetical protein ACJ72D_30570 [Marmoricola sp.]